MTFEQIMSIYRAFALAEEQRLLRGEGTKKPIGLLPVSEAERIVIADLESATR